MGFFSGEKFHGQALGEFIGGPDQGCRTDFFGNGASVQVQGTGSVDDNFMITFFNSQECDPDTEIAHADGDCMTVKGYRSFEVLDLSK